MPAKSKFFVALTAGVQIEGVQIEHVGVYVEDTEKNAVENIVNAEDLDDGSEVDIYEVVKVRTVKISRGISYTTKPAAKKAK